jgi:tRNA (uracil-5-)-methyltransferase TRM9
MDNVYDRIAEGWYNHRHRTIFKTELERLAARWGGGRLLNVGCAHGPDFLPFRDGFELHGVDSSANMLALAAKYAEKNAFKVTLQQADARSLPYADGTFDRAVAVAVYHHIEDAAGRLQAFHELYRVLKPGGEAFVTCWNRWQRRFWFKPRDLTVPWRTDEETVERFYHLFTFREMKRTARAAGFTVLELAPEDRYRLPVRTFARNVCALLRREE